MPKFVQQVAGKTLSLFEPRLDWAREKISILGETAGSLKGTYIEPRLDWAREKIAPVSTKIVEVQGFVLVKSLNLIDSSESFIDRFLPVISTESESEDLVEKEKHGLPLRIVRLPLRAPIRVTMVVYMKASGIVETVVLSGRHVAGVARDRQLQFAENILQRTKPLTDKVQSGYHSTALRLQAGKDSARNVISVNVNGVIVRLRLVEAKDWSVNKTDSLKKGTVSVVATIMQGAHVTSARVIGEHRATFIFTKLQQATFVLTRIQLPLVLCDKEKLLETREVKGEAQLEVQDSIAG